MASENKPQPVTKWLRDWQRHPNNARLDERPVEALYSELRPVAAQLLLRESRSAFTPTELVHETWLRLKPPETVIADRNSFLRLASVAMRHLLVDQARERLAKKRYGVMQTITLSLADSGTQHVLDDMQMLDLDRALDALAGDHPRVAEAVTLRTFAGMDLNELAVTLSVSLATVKRDLSFGRAWLTAKLQDSQP